MFQTFYNTFRYLDLTSRYTFLKKLIFPCDLLSVLFFFLLLIPFFFFFKYWLWLFHSTTHTTKGWGNKEEKVPQTFHYLLSWTAASVEFFSLTLSFARFSEFKETWYPMPPRKQTINRGAYFFKLWYIMSKILRNTKVLTMWSESQI